MGRVDFLSYPFIIAYPFIREVRVHEKGDQGGIKTSCFLNRYYRIINLLEIEYLTGLIWGQKWMHKSETQPEYNVHSYICQNQSPQLDLHTYFLSNLPVEN